MVTISNFHVREGKENKPFIVLELTGEIEIIQSSITGRFYATAKRCQIPSSFSEEIAKTLIGKQLQGRIERVQTDAYDYTVKETGEVISLTHTYVYNPEEKEQIMPNKPTRDIAGA
jgi:hypothetical protein